MAISCSKIICRWKAQAQSPVAALLLILFFWTTLLSATHIVGGEMYYECLGNNQYRITLKVYRDCFLGQAPFDDPAIIGIFDGNHNLVRVESIYSPQITNIPVVLDNPCLVAPPNVCVEEGIYESTISLPPNSTGYYLAYQRCCRNHSILNLVNPGDQGATYVAFIPDSVQVQCNSSPRFANFPPVAICAGEPLHFDHSATDPDGDSLAYKLCATFDGASSLDPAPNPPASPPYSFITYSTGYNGLDPMDANPPLAINSKTGLLTGTPNLVGQFVVGVCVEEYRNGILIGTHSRDFQFNVANCNKQTVAAIPIPIVGDTSINECSVFTISFGNNSTGASTYFWDFGVDNLSNDTSIVRYPTYTFPDTGTYRVMLVANPYSACSDTDFVSVKVYPILAANFGSYDVCAKTALHFTDSSSTTAGTLTSWAWNFGDGFTSADTNPKHVYTSSGTFPVTLTVKNSIGCRESANKNVIIHPIPNADFVIDGYCVFQEVSLRDTSTVGTGQIIKWEWFLDGGIPLDSMPQTSYIFNDPGSHPVTLVVTSENGCTDTITKPVEIQEKPAADAWGDTTVCIGDSVQLFGQGGSTYTWGATDGSLSSTAQNPIVLPQKNTTYIFTGSNDCYFDTALVQVNVFPPPDLKIRPDTSIFYGQSVKVYANSLAGISFAWQPADGTFDSTSTNFVISPAQTTTYTVTTTDANGCKNTRDVTIYLRPICDHLYMPTAFSPNGDGRNDRFSPVDFGQNDLEELRIYNRWGELIFKTNDFERGWDGTFQGVPQEVGTYAYIVQGTCERTPIRYAGNVTLLR